jgi:hypothetical protein
MISKLINLPKIEEASVYEPEFDTFLLHTTPQQIAEIFKDNFCSPNSTIDRFLPKEPQFDLTLQNPLALWRKTRLPGKNLSDLSTKFILSTR